MSLADVYNVSGSIAGIEQLESREVSLVHEMGGTVFSERFSTETRRADTGDILQSVNFDTIFASDPPNVTRVLGVTMLADVDARLARAQLSILNRLGNEQPIYAWEAGDATTSVRIVDDGQAVANMTLLVPSFTQLPNLIAGSGQPNQLAGDRFVFRGSSSAFGAGTVELVVIVYLGFARQRGISSLGLPMPSW